VRTALTFYGVAYKTNPVNLLKGEQVGVSEMEQVPRLDWKDVAGAEHSLTQSLPIIELLCDVCDAPGRPSLRPADPVARARARQIAEVLNAGTQPLQNLSHIKTIQGDRPTDVIDARAIAKAAIVKGLAAVEALLERHQTHAGFCVGAATTVADCTVVPQMFNARRFDVDLSAYPRLSKVEEALLQLPWFAAARPEMQPDAVPPPPYPVA
jgi:maleylpyruvate isomerase